MRCLRCADEMLEVFPCAASYSGGVCQRAGIPLTRNQGEGMSQNIVDIIFDDEALTDIDGALTTLDTRFAGLVALDPVKRRRLHKMGDKSEAFCRLAVDVLTANPQILPANFDLAALQRDVAALDALRLRTVQVMRLYQRMLDTEMALGSDMMSNSVEGYRLLSLAGKGSGLDGLRKQLAVRFKNKRSKEEPEEGGEPGAKGKAGGGD